MSEDILYYVQESGYTYFLRFYKNGLVLRAHMEDKEVADHKDEIPAIIVKSTYGVDKGQYRVVGKKITFDIELEGDLQNYQGEIRDDGSIQLTVCLVSSKKGGPFVTKPWDNSIQFDWKNTRYNSEPTGPLDLRLSTYEQLQNKLGEHNVFIIAHEFLRESELPIIQCINEFFNAASDVLPGAELVTGLKWHIACGNKTYALNKNNPEPYVSDMQIVKDLNAILEDRNTTKRIFYFDDFSDNDWNPSYFYADKDLGLQLIEFVNDPPCYTYFEFEKRDCNRNIKMQYVDSTTQQKAEYYKQLLPDF
jgi:hypothetical protein